MQKKKDTKKNKIVSDIIKLIVSRKFKPGDRLIESDLADYFSTSRAPVREALGELASIGFVTQIPRKGFKVISFTRKEVEDSYTVAGLIEGFALSQSIQYFYDSDFVNLEKILDNINQAIAKNHDIVDLTVNDAEFHHYLTSKYKNSIIQKLELTTQKNIAHYIYFQEWQQSQPLEMFYERHKKIIEVMKTKDVYRIEQTIRDHYNETGHLLAEYLEKNSSDFVSLQKIINDSIKV